MSKKAAGIAGKLIFIGIIISLLMLANMFIGFKLNDREVAKDDAVRSISSAAGDYFYIKDISIVVPYVQHKKVNGSYQVYNHGDAQIHAKVLNYDADIKTEMRQLGIYSSPIFNGQLKIDGEFLCNLRNNTEYTYNFDKAVLFIRMKDRSVVEAPIFTINGAPYETVYNGRIDNMNNDSSYLERYNGLCSEYKYKEGKNTFSTVIRIRGARNFTLSVSGEHTKAFVKSDYKAPGFTGFDYLPDTREISDQGFTAEWNIPFGSANSDHELGFALMDGVDVYKMVERAVNYAFLFVIVPFIVLFLFEIFLQVNLHPVNYLLSGAASIVFFLLLLSFSEHIPFAASYVISAVASGVMTSLYVAWITDRYKTGFQMSAVFAMMYGYLCFSLQSEDYALLIGSIFIFVIIAALMFFTRKVDWNSLGKPKLEKEM